MMIDTYAEGAGAALAGKPEMPPPITTPQEALEAAAQAYDQFTNNGTPLPDGTNFLAFATMYFEQSADFNLSWVDGRRGNDTRYSSPIYIDHQKAAADIFTKAAAACRAAMDVSSRIASQSSFQTRVRQWSLDCFGAEVTAERLERGDRFLEEVFELLQSGNYPRERIAQLAAYVWSRPTGEPSQEVGGVMVTLAAYCQAHGLDMHQAGETELERVGTKVEAIRAKQAAKPVGSALPQAWSGQVAIEALSQAAQDVLAERARQISAEGWTPEHDDAYMSGDLACAAIAYLMAIVNPNGAHHWWPPGWNREWFKPTNARRDLVKAAALICAEIERLDRATQGEGGA